MILTSDKNDNVKRINIYEILNIFFTQFIDYYNSPLKLKNTKSDFLKIVDNIRIFTNYAIVDTDIKIDTAVERLLKHIYTTKDYLTIQINLEQLLKYLPPIT